ncbi:archease [Candidatus Bipolaricaulota bacterium]|nr:archease [Candidatus Bipolaricaulota bacterium]
MNYEYLDHGADVGVRARAQTFTGLLASAARALFSLMADLEGVRKSTEERLTVEGEDEEDLLYEWLGELLSLSQLQMTVYSEFDLEVEKTADRLTLHGRLRGEEIDPSRHSLGTEVKGITYQGLEVTSPDPDEWSCVFVVDV